MLTRPGQSVKVKWRPVLVIVSVMVLLFLLISSLTSHNANHDSHHEHDGPLALSSDLERRGLAPVNGNHANNAPDAAPVPHPLDDVSETDVQDSLGKVQGKLQDTLHQVREAEAELSRLRGKRIEAEAAVKRLKISLDQANAQRKLPAKRILPKEAAMAQSKHRQPVLHKGDPGVVVLQAMGGTPEKSPNMVDSKLRDHTLVAQLAGQNEQQRGDASYRRFAFNEYASSQLSLHRPIKDSRAAQCKDIVYPKQLPSATVIICFVNEAWSALFRTVWSVLDRTPEDMLHEIILLDDASDASWLQEPLEEELARLPVKVKLVRSPQRLGLIRARLLGADHATGEYMIFLDSHCEANLGWIQPLLAWMAEDKRRVVCPSIDRINNRNMNYEGGGSGSRGTFHWTLDFTWEYAPRSSGEHSWDPIRSPTMAGGLFGIHREYFYEIGSYDEGMDGWGGENLEMSFRIWQCGGELHIIPCSRVGHIFRDSHPYTIPNSTINDTFLRNSIRLAEVWMDDYKDVFYDIRPSARSVDIGDVSERRALRDHLQCKSFDWYMKNVVPGKPVPDDKFVVARGQLRTDRNICMDKGAANLAYPCHPKGTLSISQAFWFTSNNEVRYVWDTCVGVYGSKLSLGGCNSNSQGWTYDESAKQLKHGGKCMSASMATGFVLADCDSSDANQRIVFTGTMNA
eukprot:m.152584 g.152584  ORF g.152584 m.152584 type:complete len:684 (+) comp16362_c1_seq1:110-2161(+)